MGRGWPVQVGLLDIDICGPSMPRMLGLEGQDMHSSNAVRSSTQRLPLLLLQPLPGPPVPTLNSHRSAGHAGASGPHCRSVVGH